MSGSSSVPRVPSGIAVEELSRPDVVVLIDGRSGAGKSTFADALVASWPGAVAPVLVRMDDVYPGWGGLEAATRHVGAELLRPRRAGRVSRWRRHDWETGGPAEWHEVPVDRPLVLEGCGALSRANATAADLRIWLEAAGDVRKTRALERDGGAFDAHWDMWTDQMEAFIEREDPLAFADVVLRNDDLQATRWLDETLSRSTRGRR